MPGTGPLAEAAHQKSNGSWQIEGNEENIFMFITSPDNQGLLYFVIDIQLTFISRDVYVCFIRY